MSEPIDIAEHKAELSLTSDAAVVDSLPIKTDYLSSKDVPPSPYLSSSPTTPEARLSRTNSYTSMSDGDGDDEGFPPLDRLTMFDVLENLALPQRLERLQQSFAVNREKVRKQQQKLRSTGVSAKEKVVEEWRRVVPTADEQLEQYKKRMRDNIERMGKRWKDAKTVTAMEKMSFIAGVLNIFLSGYFIGAWPEYFYYWYTAQLAYFMPIRWYKYHKIGYHYFLADLCYFVNLLLVLAIWFFPNSKRLFISTYCLAFGNNAIAIVLWRNSLVFHSMDKVASLFIHIMPCATLHCIVHLMPPDLQLQQFPAVHSIRFSAKGSPEHYSLGNMILWSTIPYAVWQLGYHFLITVRRREKIAAGRPTSFTWLRKSYAKNALGRMVLSLPEVLQEPAFMVIQYVYALVTMIPCPIWFWYRWASTAFLMAVFTWATYNGATFYIDVFGKRMEKELNSLRKEVAKWQATPDGKAVFDSLPTPGAEPSTVQLKADHSRSQSVDDIPLLNDQKQSATTATETTQDTDGIRQR
ncbi:hypothetical protein BDV97DRAFT_346727 [Delphinella strobiligena]|nr:hypothetical protein BDV97DRAFT_346727 [Delphinella strobiligena]